MRQADWFLYECVDCDQKVFHGPEGGALNCACESSRDWLVTPLVAQQDGHLEPRTSMRSLVVAS